MAKPKPVTVNIKGDYPEIRKVKPTFTSEGKTLLVMEHATENKVGWSIDITNAISHDIKGKAIIDVIRGDRYPIAYKTVDSDHSIRKEIFPFLSLDQIKQFADLEVFKKAVSGVREELKKLGPLIWITLFLVAISCLLAGINIYMANGLAGAIHRIPIPTPTPTPPPHV